MRLLPFLLLLGLLFACESQTAIDTEAVIEDKVMKRLNEFERVLNERCRNEALEEAGRLADSIILERARRMKDTLVRPPKPIRPLRPESKGLSDSIILAPLRDTLAN